MGQSEDDMNVTARQKPEESRTLSVKSYRNSRARPAPRADRMAISLAFSQTSGTIRPTEALPFMQAMSRLALASSLPGVRFLATSMQGALAIKT